MHIVGGGSKNELLNKFTANAVGIPVVAGPIEATAIGNLLVQAISMQHLSSLSVARRVVHESFRLATFEPQDRQAWDSAYRRFSSVLRPSASSGF
jgi:rhamnulokinase